MGVPEKEFGVFFEKKNTKQVFFIFFYVKYI